MSQAESPLGIRGWWTRISGIKKKEEKHFSINHFDVL